MTTFTPGVFALLAAAADRIDSHVTPASVAVSPMFPRGILAMSARAVTAPARAEVESAERAEMLRDCNLAVHTRDGSGLRTQRDSALGASQARVRADRARDRLRESEAAASRDVEAALDLIGPIPAGITRGGLADLFREFASLSAAA